MSQDSRPTDVRDIGQWRRRGVLRGFGAGAAISVGGLGLASQEDDEGEAGDDDDGEAGGEAEGDGRRPSDRGCDPCLDKLTGYTGAAIGEAEFIYDDAYRPDHEVRMNIARAGVVGASEAGDESEQGEAGGESEDESEQQARVQAASIELGGETEGWVGRSPSDIEGEQNPTLSLTPGEFYEVTWENLDGQPHNFMIFDEDDTPIVQSDAMNEQGETQTVEFEATEEMVGYLCGFHPSSMRGEVELEQAETGQGDGEETDEGEETPAGAGGDGAGDGAVPDFFYDPVGLLVRPGDQILFRTIAPEDREMLQGRAPPEHTVTAYHPRVGGRQRRVPEDAWGFSSGPIFADEFWLYQFDAEGVYDVLCLPHERLGMVMRIVVLAEDSEAAPEAPGAPGEDERGPPEVAAAVLDAPELDPQNIVEQQSVAWTDLSGVEATPPGDGGA